MTGQDTNIRLDRWPPAGLQLPDPPEGYRWVIRPLDLLDGVRLHLEPASWWQRQFGLKWSFQTGWIETDRVTAKWVETRAQDLLDERLQSLTSSRWPGVYTKSEDGRYRTGGI